MGRRGVAFVAMMAAVISAVSLSYAVFWAYQDEPAVRATGAPLPVAPGALAAPSATAAPPEADRDAKATPAAAALPPPPTEPAAQPTPQAGAHDAPPPPERIETRRVGRAKILTMARSAVAPTTSPPVEPAATPIAKSIPPGPFAALPAQTDSPTIGAAPAPPRNGLRHAPPRRVAALPPHPPVSAPALQEARPITILRGGPSLRPPVLRPPGLPRSSAAALAEPPAVTVIRPHRSDPRSGALSLGTPGPLILRIQN
jgi:hypothetical protein